VIAPACACTLCRPLAPPPPPRCCSLSAERRKQVPVLLSAWRRRGKRHQSNTQTGSKSEKAVKLYDMCMDTTTVNSLGAAPLLPLLRSLRTSLESSSSPVENSVALLHKRGISSFFNVYVDADPVQPTLYSLTMEQGGLTLSTKDYYVRTQYDSVRKGFQALVENVFAAMSLDKNTDLTTELNGTWNQQRECRSSRRRCFRCGDADCERVELHGRAAQQRGELQSYNPVCNDQRWLFIC